MSLFGSSPPDRSEAPMPSRTTSSRSGGGGGGGLFDEGPTTRGSSNSLFADDDDNGEAGDDSPWSMPTPRKQQSRAELIRNMLPAGDVPDSYIDTFDTVVRLDGSAGRVTPAGLKKLFATARLDAAAESRIVSLVAAGQASADELALGRGEFNVLLALVGLAQEGETISLDGVDERRRNLPQPQLAGLTAEPVLPPVDELGAKPPQTPVKDPEPPSTPSQPRSFRPTMTDPEDDPWGSPGAQRSHSNVKPNGTDSDATNSHPHLPEPHSNQHSEGGAAGAGHPVQSSAGNSAGGWGYFDGSNPAAPNFGGDSNPTLAASPFGPANLSGAERATSNSHSAAATSRTLGGRTGSSVEENIVVTLMPEKEGVFMFQHHNYEVASQRRGSTVIRRYSDFVWLLDCLQKRYPFRVLPLLPPKRMGVNGSHLSNDGGFIEKRRRGLARFLNAVVRHPVLGQEQLVVMFLTVPTELAVWRKQANLSVQDEFTDKPLPPGLEDSLPSTLEDLFDRTRSGVRRSAELYINACNIMDRLVKRSEGVAADHARVATSLQSLTEASADTYATDTNEVPLLNDGLTAMSKHLMTCQSLMEDESRGWDQGVLEDLKRQRDALVSVREMFERRERLDKDNIPYLERRIQTNETKLAGLRSKPDGTVKPGEIEKVAESIIKDKESIVQQHNRSIFVKECIRDELITFQTTQYHVSRLSQDWAGERVKYAEMLADNWRRLLDELEGMPLGD